MNYKYITIVDRNVFLVKSHETSFYKNCCLCSSHSLLWTLSKCLKFCIRFVESCHGSAANVCISVFSQSFVWLWPDEGQLSAKPRPELLLRRHPPCHQRLRWRVVAGEARHASRGKRADWRHSQQEKVGPPFRFYGENIERWFPVKTSHCIHWCICLSSFSELKRRNGPG